MKYKINRFNNSSELNKSNYNDNSIIKEDINPIIGIDNFLNSRIMIVLATSWLLSGKYKIDNLKSNIEYMKDSFLDYCNSMGYTIDKEALNSKFNQLINSVRKIIQL